MATLTENMIDAGERLVEELDKAHLNVSFAAWLLNDEEDLWTVVLGLPYVKKNGPRKSYELIGKVLKKVNRPELSLSNVTAVDRMHPWILSMKSALRTPAEGTSRIRFTNNTVNGVKVPDALIYRSSH